MRPSSTRRSDLQAAFVSEKGVGQSSGCGCGGTNGGVVVLVALAVAVQVGVGESVGGSVGV
jgi:hypothetical protein